MKNDKGLKPEQAESVEGINKNRRRAVLGAAGGATALAAWQTPVIESIVLPAHAQTSPASPPPPPPPPPPPAPSALTFFASGATVTPIAMNKSPLDWLVPEAIASEVPITSEYSVSIMQTAPETDNYQIDVFERILEGQDNVAELILSGTASEASGGSLGISQNPCERRVEAIGVEIVELSADQVRLNFTNRGDSVLVPQGSGSLPTPVCPPPVVVLQDFDSRGRPVAHNDAGGVGSSVLDMLIPEANAGFSQQGETVAIAIDNGSGVYTVTVQDNFNTWSGQLSDGGGTASLTFEAFGSCSESSNINASLTVSGTGSSATMGLDIPSLEEFVTLFPAENPTLGVAPGCTE